MTGSPLTSAYRLRDCLQYMMWKDLKSEPLRQYSTISFNSHATQAFAYLQQGPDELLEMYLHCASELLSKIHHTTDMSQMPAKGLSTYTVVYGLHSTKPKDKVAGHQSTYWNTIKDCFSDIHAFGTGYERVNGYSRVDFNILASAISEIKSTKEP